MSENRILTELPKRGSKNVDWKSTVGMDVELIYNDELYVVKIVGYECGNMPTLKIEYNNNIKSISVTSFLRARVGKLLNLITKDFKFKIGEQIGSKIITHREYRQRKHKDNSSIINVKWYKYKCGKCGWEEGWSTENDLLKETSCSCCSNRTVVEDINSIWATDRWMCGLGLSEKDAKTHTKSSSDEVIVTCPNCGKQKEIRITTLYRYGLGCICGNGSKYPERFMANILNQLNVNYIPQLTKTTFDWCENFRYDFYIPSINMIIETHGGQHYKDCSWSKVHDVQENDKCKEELATKNGIRQYIVIDCRKSELEWIKNNIINSKLNELFDLSKIDWLKCEEFAVKNLVKEVCDYWNNKEEYETTKHLAVSFNISRPTITEYLKKGTELAWCNYNPKEESKKVLSGVSHNKKKIAMYDLSGNIIKEECSATKLIEVVEEEMGISLSLGHISSVCRGKRKTYKGYIFKYI